MRKKFLVLTAVIIAWGSVSFADSDSSSSSPSSPGSSTPMHVEESGSGRPMVCPEGGESYPENVAFCPKHGVKLERTSGGTDILQDSTTGMEFVFAEGGCFTMGTRDDDKDSQDSEKPGHKVCLDSFYIGRFEVTQDQWKSVMGSNTSNFIGGQRPVEQVSWRDAQEFISRLNEASGRKYRLPTEAEWEFAARGGVKSKGFKYAGSDSVTYVAWFSENSGRESIPVGRKEPNELGIYDMSGNVWEWCQDWYAKNYYRWSNQDNPQGADGGSDRVLRGGGWNSLLRSVRVAFRDGYHPAARLNHLGIRLVLPAGQ